MADWQPRQRGEVVERERGKIEIEETVGGQRDRGDFVFGHAVLAEQAGSSEGLGHLITQAIPQFETAQAYAAVAVLSAFAILLFAAITALERALLPWAAGPRQGPAT